MKASETTTRASDTPTTNSAVSENDHLRITSYLPFIGLDAKPGPKV
jgi:hypothetical protein